MHEKKMPQLADPALEKIVVPKGACMLPLLVPRPPQCNICTAT